LHPIGDNRPNTRFKVLTTLFAVNNNHFFTSPGRESKPTEEINQNLPPPQHGDFHTLQQLFRGVIAPSLEHAEVNSIESKTSQLILPEGFIQFMSDSSSNLKLGGGRKDRIKGDRIDGNNWLETTFDHLMDSCVSLCLKSMETYKTDLIIEEILAMFNNCLISDSGALAVRGLKRLHHFVTSDLNLDSVTDDTWATVCHMLRRCLMIRGLPKRTRLPEISSESEIGEESTDGQDSKEEDTDMLSEFVLQEEILADRRYIFCNATMIIEKILSSKTLVANMSMRWYLFLLTGLGRGIQEWEDAAAIMGMYPPQNLISTSVCTPPHYCENALYARKRMVRFLLSLMSRGDVFVGSNKDSLQNDDIPLRKKSAAAAKNLIKEETSALLKAFLAKDTAVTASGLDKAKVTELEYLTKIVCDLLDGINKLDDSQLENLSGLTPTLSACIQVNNQSVRDSVNSLVNRMFEGPLSDRLTKIDDKTSSSKEVE